MIFKENGLMLDKKYMIATIGVIFLLCTAVISHAQLTDTDDPAEDEAGTFLSVSPDALIVLDLSGSMAWNPAGGTNIWGSSLSCTGTFYASSGPGHNVNCSRVAIAKRALFSVLDDDNNGTINDQDAKSLNVRIGYMRFRDGDDTGGDYSKGNNRMISNISKLGSNTGTSYQMTYCGNSITCSDSSTCSKGECIASASATGGTPLTSSLKEAFSYLNVHKASDAAKACRQKFVILLTDGADTYACSGDGSECQEHMYKRRRATVAAAKALYDAGYRVFVIGFGSSMPLYLQNNLNWMAYYGGTDNPLENNSGTATDYNIPLGCHADPVLSTACCNLSSNPTACYPSGVSACATDSAWATETCQGSSTDRFKATANDPGFLSLSGYAFIAGDADQLTAALKNALSTISAATYSFTSSSVQAVRTVDENFVYEASFTPVDYDPFWKGHLKRFSIQSDGNVNTSADWDAGAILQGTAASGRNIYTWLSGTSLSEFNATNVTYTKLAVANSTVAGNIIAFIRGGEQSGANTGWKLGDVFHSSPLSIGTPNYLFYDRWDKSSPKAFDLYRLDNVRTSSNSKRIIMIGANDGQLHAFQTGELSTTGGRELWSFVPPNLLSKLQFIAHASHPTSLLHHYYVDGPTSAADIWLNGSSATSIDSTYKTKDQWHTYMVMSEGRGGISTLWSSSANCESNFSPTYSSIYAHYCGYYAFDITNTISTPPAFKWKLGGTSGLSATEGVHMGQAWSKMFMGRVRINNTERWVGLIGGGYSGTKVSGGGGKSGKGFYVVDLNDGDILWTFTNSGPDGAVNADMDYDLVAGPVAVDSDNDGFWDTAYVGDVGGNIWRFRFCLKNSDSTCGVANWSGSMLFNNASNSSIRPIYTPVSVTTDKSSRLWVYVGTGDKNDPTAANAQEKIYAIRDSDRTSTHTINDLDDITSVNSTYDPYSTTKSGWYINMAGSSEKILAEPVLFEGRVYFTTYTPGSNTDPCNAAGTAKLYIVDYITGAGKINGARSEVLTGTGIPSAPIISRNPYGGTDIYVSTSVASSISGSHTDKAIDPNINTNPSNNVIYWRDNRVQ